MNRIDSRARGNAPQLLEKYRKLAHDAHLNGDRVQEEYYLQFADHYFRVIADQKQRQEESRQPRRDDRQQDSGDDFGAYDDSYGDHGHAGGYSEQDRAPRAERDSRGRGPSEDEAESAPARAEPDSDDAAETGERSIYEPPANPFVRDPRGAPRGPKPRKPRRRPQDDDGESAAATSDDTGTGNFDPATLPPSISAKASESAAVADEGEKPKRRRTRKAAPPADDASDTLETVNS